MTDIARTGDARSFNPLDQLPPALVKPTGEFYAFFSDSLKGTTGIAFRLLWWMRPREEGGEGLTADEATTAMRRLMRPEKCGPLTYAGQVQAALAEEIFEIVKRRRAKESLDRIKRNSGLINRLTAGIGMGGV